MEVRCTMPRSDATPSLDLHKPLPSGGAWSVHPRDMKQLLHAIRSRYIAAYRAGDLDHLSALEVVIHDDALAHIPLRWLYALSGWYDYFRVDVRLVGDADALFGPDDDARRTEHQRTARVFVSGCDARPVSAPAAG